MAFMVLKSVFRLLCGMVGWTFSYIDCFVGWSIQWDNCVAVGGGNGWMNRWLWVRCYIACRSAYQLLVLSLYFVPITKIHQYGLKISGLDITTGGYRKCFFRCLLCVCVLSRRSRQGDMVNKQCNAMIMMSRRRRGIQRNCLRLDIW